MLIQKRVIKYEDGWPDKIDYVVDMRVMTNDQCYKCHLRSELPCYPYFYLWKNVFGQYHIYSGCGGCGYLDKKVYCQFRKEADLISKLEEI